MDIAANGREAVEASARLDYDHIFMDCQMPEMDGFEATRRIRGGERSIDAGVPIIALTASAMTEDRQRCLDSGMDDYLSKPIHKNDLKLVVERWAGTAN